jgi:hypothetical protein
VRSHAFAVFRLRRCKHTFARPGEFPLKGVPPLTGDGYEGRSAEADRLDSAGWSDREAIRPARVDSTDSAPEIDLPLHDQQPEPKEEPPLFQQTASALGSGRGFAIGMLVIGLMAGFGAGFLVGQRLAPPPPPRAFEVPRPAPLDPRQGGPGQVAPGVSLDAPQAEPAPAFDGAQGAPSGSRGASPVLPAQNFTEAPVTDAPPTEVKAPEVQFPVAPANAPAARTAVSTIPGTLRFDSRPPSATVYVDNVRVGVTPMTMSNVGPGAHTVRVELPGHSPWVTSVNVEPGAQLFVGASLE